MTTVTLRFDDAMKRELDDMVEEMGMNLMTFLWFTQNAHSETAASRLPVQRTLLRQVNTVFTFGQGEIFTSPVFSLPSTS